MAIALLMDVDSAFAAASTTMAFPDTKTPDVHETALDVAPNNHGTGNTWIRLMTKLKWYPKDMLAEEKALILKLDLSILIFGCLSFFTKYLDQQSITNAYVSGSKYSTMESDRFT